jgi:hypothetical protein
MSQSGAQAAAFFRDVVSHGVVWYVRDDQGSPRFGARRVWDGDTPYWAW